MHRRLVKSLFKSMAQCGELALSAIIPCDWLFLIPIVFVTSFISGVFGIGGGLLLVIIMSWMLPPIELLYAHASVQLLSNFTRAYIHRKTIDRGFIKNFSLGILIGFIPAFFIFGRMDIEKLKPLLYVYGLVMMLVPAGLMTAAFQKLPNLTIPISVPLMGAMFGAIGPYLTPYFLSLGFSPAAFVATEAVAAVINHIVRLGIYFGSDRVSVSSFSASTLWLPFALFPSILMATRLSKVWVYRMEARAFFIWVRILVILICFISLLFYFMG